MVYGSVFPALRRWLEKRPHTLTWTKADVQGGLSKVLGDDSLRCAPEAAKRTIEPGAATSGLTRRAGLVTSESIRFSHQDERGPEEGMIVPGFADVLSSQVQGLYFAFACLEVPEKSVGQLHG